MNIERQITIILAGVAMAGLLTACMEHASSGSQYNASAMSPPLGSSSNRVDLMIRNAKQEVASLRADLGSARIAAVKKEVELEEMRREIAQTRQRVSDLQQTYDQQRYAAEKQQVELMAVKADRDRFQQEKSEMQRELAEVPSLRAALTASQMADGQVQARVKELESMLTAINVELATVRAVAVEREERLAPRRSLHQNANTGAASKVPEAAIGFDADGVREGLSIASMGKEGATDAVVYLTNTISIEPEWTSVTVKQGDTLGDLARAYGATIKQIKEGNGLTGDVIRRGQLLRIPLRPQK